MLAGDSGAIYSTLYSRGEKLRLGLERLLRERGLPVITNGEGPAFHVSFGKQRARTYRDTLDADAAAYSDFGLALLDEGVFVLPDGRWYLSIAHTEEAIDATLSAVRRVLA